MNKSICIDIDGVLADFEGAFCRKFGYDDRDVFRLEDRYPTHKDEIGLFVLSSATYEQLDVIPLGVKIARWCEEQDLEIYVLSSRPVHVTQVTGLWLKRNKVPFHFLELGVSSKIPEIVRIDPLFVIDDQASICQKCNDFQVYSMLFDQPWNRSNGLPNLIKRIRNFQDFETFAEHIKEISGIF